MALRFDEAAALRMRKRLMAKGLELATLLEDVLAGLDRTRGLAALGPSKPGEKPEEKLRRYLEMVEAKRRLLDAGDNSFGRCQICNADLGAMPLEEMPWADRCARCPG